MFGIRRQAKPVPRSATHTNAYAADGKADNYGVTIAAGADPSNYGDGAEPGGSGNHYYYPWPGWAPTLTHDDFDNPSDPHRLEELPRVDRRANLRDFWGWWGLYDRDTKARESVTETSATGWAEQKGAHSRAPDPRWTPPPEPRPTQLLSPSRYEFSRPFDQTIARRFNGSHMSLADNRRNYEILTMHPVAVRRNTYRAEPTPWDTDMVDQSVNPTPWKPDQRLQSPDIPLPVYQRAYRAGG